MRSFLALGVVSLVVAAGMVACGDDSGDDGTGLGGTGGTAGGGSGGGGAGGTSGGGTGGGGTGGTTGGTGGGTGGAGAMPPAANCNGCVQLTVPAGGPLVTGATNYQAGFVFNADAPAAPFDLSEVTTITWRIQALTTNAMYYVQPFLQMGPPENPTYDLGAYAGNVALTPAAFAPNTWVDVSIDVAALGGGAADAGAPDAGDSDAGFIATTFDKAYTRTVGLQVGALAGSAVGFVSVQVDSVTVVGTSNFTTKTFDTSVEGMTLNNFQAPTATPMPSFH